MHFYYEGTTLSFFTFYVDLGIVIVQDPLYISQSKTVPFYVMYVSGMFPVKLFEDPPLGRFAHPGPLIFDL